jgi:hypothetical protein
MIANIHAFREVYRVKEISNGPLCAAEASLGLKLGDVRGLKAGVFHEGAHDLTESL